MGSSSFPVNDPDLDLAIHPVKSPAPCPSLPSLFEKADGKGPDSRPGEDLHPVPCSEEGRSRILLAFLQDEGVADPPFLQLCWVEKLQISKSLQFNNY